jgi:Delta7-sterol 5-desaturase
MDVVLEFTDRLCLDRMYAALLPLSSGPLDFLKSNGTLGYTADHVPTTNGWHYVPASKYLSVAPTEWAYQSSWPRDDPLRQFISLYLITW